MTGSGTWGVVGVMAAWCMFALAFAVQRRPHRGRSSGDALATAVSLDGGARKREPVAWAGIVLQAVAVGMFFGARRQPVGAPMMPAHPGFNAALLAACVALAWLGVGLILWAVHALGRHWAVAARLLDGHELVTAGPYRLVRNPVYTGFFALALATAGVVSRPWTIVVGAPVFLAGTLVRVRAEERLLRARFGARFDEFAARVPALFPRLKP